MHASKRPRARACKMEHFYKQYKNDFIYNTLQLTKSKIFIEAHDLWQTRYNSTLVIYKLGYTPAIAQKEQLKVCCYFI
jgi:hypothetical protein